MRDDLDLDRLVPHRPPMRLVEGISAIDEASITCVCSVRDSWPGACNGQVPSSMLIELLAQTAATFQGWQERHESEYGRGGLLVGIPSARFAAPRVPVGTELSCLVRATHGTQSYRAFDGEVRDKQGKVWLTGAIQAFRTDKALIPGAPE
jgi:predicted hotdog family 3-hydroxylacyl-ACP dehydratase